MKYIKGFDKIIENKTIENLDEAVNASGYIKAGKLGYNDQFIGRRSLSWTLSVDLGLKATDQYVGPWIGFDSVEMYALGKKGGTILDDALTNKYTYEELKAAAAKYLGIKESIDENAKSDAKEIFDELMDVNGEEIADMDSQEAMTILKMRGIRGGKANMIAKELLKMTSSIGESLTEAKKFKPGDKWSSDFDYDGMLKYALKVNEKTPIKMLNKLFDSATDVNYHTPFRNLGIAIDWIEDGDKEGATDYIKNFHDDIKKEMKDQGIK